MIGTVKTTLNRKTLIALKESGWRWTEATLEQSPIGSHRNPQPGKPTSNH